MVNVSLRALKKSYGSQAVVHGVDLDVHDGEFIVLVGPSGCGKSTILRMIAGLEGISDGELSINDRVVNHLGAKDRNLAMVFQDYALYPHMTVAANIGFGLKMHGIPAGERTQRIKEIAELLQLTPYLDRKPRALSGGQRQRVAMGRALSRSAQLFLFDEPLSNLDAKLRTEVRTQIKLLHQKLNMTSIFVTHDQTEAMTLADRIVCLEAGRIAQIGTPEELYNFPRNVFVATFIGSPQINLLEAEGHGHTLTLRDGQVLKMPCSIAALEKKRRVLLAIRPEDLTDESRMNSTDVFQPLEISHLLAETVGSDTYVIGELGGTRLTARCASAMRPDLGSCLRLQVNVGRLHLFDPETSLRI
ncbi:sn-glycerol-3-phosphate ABC transporter ATP-binding protein UgpC [Mesorhizobium sp. M0244]|uniref:ABC transporter ATP-binding protein n=1 Tax=Mesorhizobium sp. M0244 TaxID=2956926 RepID=UPI0033381A56